MNTGNFERYEQWAAPARRAVDNVIYLEAHREKRRREKNAAALWNTLFTLLAVGMIFCVFIR